MPAEAAVICLLSGGGPMRAIGRSRRACKTAPSAGKAAGADAAARMQARFVPFMKAGPAAAEAPSAGYVRRK